MLKKKLKKNKLKKKERNGGETTKWECMKWKMKVQERKDKNKAGLGGRLMYFTSLWQDRWIKIIIGIKELGLEQRTQLQMAGQSRS